MLQGQRRDLHARIVKALEAPSDKRLAERALEHARIYKERGDEAYALRFLGDIAMHRDPPEIEQVETHYQQALAMANELGMRPLQAHCRRGLGTLYRR